MTIRIHEVSTLKELGKFINFPIRLYHTNPYYVPALFSDEMNTLRWDRNPAFEHSEARYWLAYDGNKIVGRVAAIINPLHYEKWGQRYIRFGWLDFYDDVQISSALMNVVEKWAVEKGMQAVHGPLGFTDLDREGLLVDGFQELATLATNYNFSYYSRHLENLGYSKDVDWVEYEMIVSPEPNPVIARIADVSRRRYKLKIFEAKKKGDLLKYTDSLFSLFDDAYAHLYGFVPLTHKQVEAYIKQYFDFIKPEFVPIVLDENNELVAFGITMPSLSRASQQCRGRLFPFGFIHLLKALNTYEVFDLYLVAVRKEYQSKGLNAILMDQMHRVFIKLGVKRVESNPELENNKNVQGQWKYYQRRQHKRRRVYIKNLESTTTPHTTGR